MDKSKKDFKDKKELRLMELRAVENEENKMIVEGYAVRFNETTLIGDKDWGWYEVIEPQALNKANMKDVPLKYQHGDTKGVLARSTKPVTRKIKEIGTLYDVSVVDFGAYPTTSIYARSKEIVGEQLRALQTSLDKDEKETLDNVEERKKLELEKLKAKIRGGLF